MSPPGRVFCVSQATSKALNSARTRFKLIQKVQRPLLQRVALLWVPKHMWMNDNKQAEMEARLPFYGPKPVLDKPRSRQTSGLSIPESSE
ncbi:hypothetical protein JTB14_023269 [Gonioctena quinquepunctata]|nr:hypothetical protein JTB14_023269 [Gonioctena quinquepunctata]